MADPKAGSKLPSVVIVRLFLDAADRISSHGILRSWLPGACGVGSIVERVS